MHNVSLSLPREKTNKQTNWKGGGLVITDTKPRNLRFNALRCGRGGAEVI